MPHWASSKPVVLEDGQGDFNGRLMVRFEHGVIPTQLRDCPHDAEFTVRADGVALSDTDTK